MTGRTQTQRSCLAVPSLGAEAVTVEGLGEALSAEIGRCVPHDGYWLVGADPLTLAASFQTMRNGFGVEGLRTLEREFGLPDEAFPFPELIFGPTPVGVLSRSAHEHRRSARLHEVMREVGHGSEMRLALVRGGRVRGGLVLFRRRGARPFSEPEAAAATRLAGPLAAALQGFVASKPLRVAPLTGPPGVAIVGGDDTIRAASPAIRSWMREHVLAGGPDIDDEALFSALCNITHTARRTAEGTAASRLFTSRGWVLLHAQPLDGLAGGDTVVTLQPASGNMLLPVAVEWYGLTPREHDVLRHLARGRPAKSIARVLGLSTHTVNDHMQAVYRKVGVAGREDLMAALVG
ncbi:helix-turn-helix transcriptional regulator [Streptomyces sp. NPDC017941]|uniref:helix-turn-helix transcriptional regulator n=1 Tax=unclassified Streptomyces TaxID=2593676 RepID=UPI0037A66257